MAHTLKNNIYVIPKINIFDYSKEKIYIPHTKGKVKKLEDIKTYTLSAYFTKRVIDYIASIVLIVLTLPITLYTIYRIKKEAPGAIIFKQKRIGKDGKIFTCYKFRSMYENSYHNPYTSDNDDRVFPWGRFMRKTRLDELPQLWNVLKGDMHLVGPRAEWDILGRKYEQKIPYYKKRYLVKPGITGWAQVNYPYGENEEDAREKLSYDLYYIKNWSLSLEIKTLIKTISVVLDKKGK